MLIAAAACDKVRPASSKDVRTQEKTPTAVQPTVGDADEGKQGSGQGGGGKQGGQAMAYLDGQVLGAVRFPEMPSTLKPVCQAELDGEPSCRYRLVDYVQSLGIPMKKVKSVQVHGGPGRIVILPGDELRKQPDAVWFSFAEGKGGKVRSHWTGTLQTNTQIDMLGNVAVYVEKTPPTWNAATREVELDGRPVSGIPYADPSIGKGTRVYVDGRLQAFIKKKQLPDNAKLAAVEGEDEQRWQLGASLDSLGIPPAGLRAADLIETDEFVARLTEDKIVRSAFVVVPESGGRIEVAPYRREISAILLFKRSKPPVR